MWFFLKIEFFFWKLRFRNAQNFNSCVVKERDDETFSQNKVESFFRETFFSGRRSSKRLRPPTLKYRGFDDYTKISSFSKDKKIKSDVSQKVKSLCETVLTAVFFNAFSFKISWFKFFQNMISAILKMPWSSSKIRTLENSKNRKNDHSYNKCNFRCDSN